LNKDPSDRGCQVCAPVPLQSHNCTGVPFAVPALGKQR